MARGNHFKTITEAAETYEPKDVIDTPYTVTWADTERDLSAWLDNRMQQEASSFIYSLQSQVMQTKDQSLIDDWRNLTTSDHFYYMCTKWFRDGDVHAYFSPYESPYDAFMNFMNALRDMQTRLVDKGVNYEPTGDFK